MELKHLVWNALTEDEQLKEMFGGYVRLFNTWSHPDAIMPYAVYRTSEQPQDPWIVSVTALTIDLFAREDKQRNLLEIERYIRQKLDAQHIDEFRFFHVRTTEVPEDERYIWHIHQAYNVRHTQDWRLQ